MNNEEAINVLKHVVGNINWDAKREEIYFTNKWVQAYEMAIAALRERDILFEQVRGYCHTCKKNKTET